MENNEGGLRAEAEFAEKYFTTGRFAECEQHISRLLAHPTLDVNPKIAMQALEMANLIAMGKANLVSAKMDLLISAVANQTTDFKVTWLFDGTKHFIGQHEKLASHRVWLGQLFNAIGGDNREEILKGMREVRAKFKK